MTVTTETVRQRLNYWNYHKPPHGYSQSTYSLGPDGHQYRNDCSGYVSMLTGMTGSPNTGMMVVAAFSRSISKADLRFGDIIIATAGAGHSSGHVILFDSWVNKAKTKYLGHDFGGGVAPRHADHVYPYEPDGRTFGPRRLLAVSYNVHPTPTKPAVPAATYTVKSGDTLSGIAARFHVPGGWPALAAYNKISDPDVINVGKLLTIPAGSSSSAAADQYTPPPDGGRWILAPGNWYGDINAGNTSHGGYYASEQPAVRWIQTRMNELGAGPIRVTGIFDAATISAVSKWQRAYYAAHGLHLEFAGQVWSDDWRYLQTDR